MYEISRTHADYLRTIRRHKHIVHISRILILLSFLFIHCTHFPNTDSSKFCLYLGIYCKCRHHRFFYFQQSVKDCTVLCRHGC